MQDQPTLHYVVSGADETQRVPASPAFPLLRQASDESDAAYVRRVARRLDRIIAAGATHLVVPRAHAGWLADRPLLVDFFTAHYDLADTGTDTGIVYALRPRAQPAFQIMVDGWQVVPGDGIALVAPHRLINPRLTLAPHAPMRGRYRGRLTITAHNLRTLGIRFVLTRPDRRAPHSRDLFLSLERPGYLIHHLPYVEATFSANDSVSLDFDLRMDRGRSLTRIEIAPIEEDNWRLHPTYPGGASFALPAVAPAGARLTLHSLTLEPTATVRQGVPYGTVIAECPTPYRKPPDRPRDAVIFSSWVPDEGLLLGDYFIAVLQRWHADSKIFVGINHGSSARWRERLAGIGLDVTIAEAPLSQTMPFDPIGFVAALDAFRRHDEAFDLVWFGHNKGGDHLDEPHYATSRWMIERTFWSRREEIEHYFENPIIGLYAPHLLMLLQEHLTQTDALQRIYDATCQPLGAMAVSAHYVMRAESVREFCGRVDKRFFVHGVEPFGGDRYFFEMAMPNVPIMQGYEPYIEPGLGGSSGPPKIDGIESILNDWRQNNAVTAIELAKWRHDPTHFRTQHREHNRRD